MPADVPAPYQPGLRWWGHLWRYLLALSIGATAWVTVVERQAEQRPVLFWVDIAVALVALPIAHQRRRHPLAVAVIVVALSPLSALSSGLVALTTVSLATRRTWWQVGLVVGLNVAAGAAFERVQPTVGDPWWLTSSLTVLAALGLVAWGMFIGSRRELVWTLRHRAENAEAERDLRAAQARGNERARIAREMHDVLAHRISQISMHAGALSYREGLSDDEVRESAGVIRAKAHEALQDLREVLGVLRAADGDRIAPQPTLADLPDLVAQAREVGTSIVFADTLPTDDGPGLPDAVGRTIYRIVQEGITNAAKHAPAATLHIRIDGSPADGVSVELRNGLGFGSTRTPGAGLGLVGLTERAELRGGWLSHGVERGTGDSPAGSFSLRAWLPWDDDAAARAVS